MTPEEEAMNAQVAGEIEDPKEEAKKPILGRFETEEEANAYIEGLEGKKEEKDKDEILNFDRGVPETKPDTPAIASEEDILSTEEEANLKALIDKRVDSTVNERVAPLTERIQRQQDEKDAEIVAKYPNYNKYLKAAHDVVSKNPGISLLNAFVSVYDTLGEMRNSRGVVLTKEQEAERLQKKKMAQVERPSGAVGNDAASKSEADQLRDKLGYSVPPGSENVGRIV